MELYGSGFNAWGQLHFDESPHREENTDDLQEFTCILRGDDIGNVRASLSHTAVTRDGTYMTAGRLPQNHLRLYKDNPPVYSTLVEASNENVIVTEPAGVTHQFSSVCDLLNGAAGQHCPELPTCTQIVAYDTGFAALTSTGSVYTWGDERYGACLGRGVSENSPADKPGLVTTLENLPTGPIAKIAAGGYILAALTTGNDLYLWGGHPGRKTIPADVSDEPAPGVIDEQDVADVAVGESHLIVLTTQGKVFVIGENKNGQLGLSAASVDSWSPVKLNLQEGTPVGVAAGPKNSFIIVKI